MSGAFSGPDSPIRRRLGDVLEEVARGVGNPWARYRVVGATRTGIAPAKEPVGKNPERYKLVEPGTIFYNPMRILLGSIAMIDDDQEPGITSPDYVVFRSKDGVVHPRWLYYWLRSQDGAAFIKTLARGAVRERLLFRRLAVGEIEIPPYEAQRRFATAMFVVERTSTAAKAQLEAAKNLAPTLVREAFDRQAGSSEEVPLGELLTLRHEVIHPRDHPKGSAVFVGLEHIESDTGRRTGGVTVERATLRGRKPVFRKGDVVYGYLRPYLNKVWVAEFDGLCSVDQYVFVVDEKRADTTYVSWFLSSPQFLRRAPIDAAPGQLPRIRGDEIASTTIPLPRLDDQKVFVDRLSNELRACDALIRASESELESVRYLPVALLRRAFRGEL